MSRSLIGAGTEPSMSVSVNPGQTQFTVTPNRASSSASVFVQAISPPFAAA